MDSCETEPDDCRSKQSSQKNSTTDITRIPASSDDTRVASSEKASSSSSSSQSVVSEESVSRNNESKHGNVFECDVKRRSNKNNKNSTTPYSLSAQCSNPPRTSQLKDMEICEEDEQNFNKNDNSVQNIEQSNIRQQHSSHGLSTQLKQNVEHSHSPRDNNSKKKSTDSAISTSNSYNDVDTATKTSTHLHHNFSSYPQYDDIPHQNHSSFPSSSSSEHKQQNQTEHRRHFYHHYNPNSRHKRQWSPGQVFSDPAVSRNRLHRHHHSNSSEISLLQPRSETSDYKRTNKEMLTNSLQNKDYRTLSTLSSAFSDRSSKTQLNSHHPSKRTLYSSSELLPSRASLSPPHSPILPDGPSLTKNPRISALLPELTDLDNEESEDGEAHIHCLFPELLVMIFCYLDVRDKGRVAQVCIRWREAAYTRTVWRGVEAKIHLRRSNPSLYRSLAKRGIRRIQILSLKRSLKDVVSGIPDLESLNLSGCYNITDAGLGQALLHRLLTVHELNLSLCKQITDYSLSRIAIYLKNLRVLHLGGCSVITNAGLFVISYGLVKLKSLDLRSCRDLSDQGIAHLAGIGDTVTNQGNVALEHLCLQDCQKLTDTALRYISLGLKNLTKVNLSFCSSVTDSGLQYLAKMPSLRKINLASCDQVTDTGLAHLARGGSRITSLDVSFCDKIGDWGLSCLAGGLFNLECLSLSACNISDNGISHIVQTMHGLTTLNIGQCHRITDRGLNLIADNLKKLSRMDIYGCTQISAKGLERIMQLPSLSSLNLGLWHKR